MCLDMLHTVEIMPWQALHFRRSWVGHDMCAAILAGPSMLLPVYMPHGGHDEEDYIATLEAVRRIMNEGKKMGSK